MYLFVLKNLEGAIAEVIANNAIEGASKLGWHPGEVTMITVQDVDDVPDPAMGDFLDGPEAA